MSNPARRHPVVILAHGRGTRLAPAASGLHKTTEHVHGRPILAGLLREIQAAGLAGRTIVSLRQDDSAARRVVESSHLDVEIEFREPTGYLPDVYRLSRRLDPRFTVIEADTVTLPGSLANFLVLAEHLGQQADLCVGIGPAAANPNGPAVLVDDRGRVVAMTWTGDPTGVVPLAAWHWTSRVLDGAGEFSRRSTSTADYVSWLVPRGATVVPIGIPAGFNINTPADLGEARRGVARWFGHPQPLQHEEGEAPSWELHSSPAQPA